MLRLRALLVVPLLAVAACGGGGQSGAAAPGPTVVTTTASIAPTPTPSPFAPNVGDRALKVGQWREGEVVRTLVKSFTQTSDASPPSFLVGESEAEGALAEIKMCVRKTATEPLKGQVYGLFNVYDKSGGQYSQASSSWDEWPPRPQWPNDVNLSPGRCVTGWILFSVPKSVRIAYVANDGDGSAASAEWKVR